MKRIIVPTDFSETAWNATIHGLAYSSIFDAELLLVHIYDSSISGSNTNYSSIMDAMVVEEAKMKEVVNRLKEIKAFGDVEIKSLCIGGDLIKSISGILTDSGDDLLVVSTKGNKSAMSKFFGTSACRLIRDINCPVLLIPNGFKFSLYTPTICAIDNRTVIEKDDLVLLEKMVRARSSANFRIINIRKDAQSEKQLPMEQFKNLNVSYDEVIGANVPTLLEQYSIMIKSRLLVLVKRDKTFFERFLRESVLDKLTLNANIPLLVLRAEH